MRYIYLFLILILFVSHSYSINFSVNQNETEVYRRVYDVNSNSDNNPNLISNVDYKYGIKQIFSYDLFLFDRASFYQKGLLHVEQSGTENNTNIVYEEWYLSVNLIEGLYIDYGEKDLAWGKAYAWNLLDIFDENMLYQTDNTSYRRLIYAEYFVDENTSLTGVSLTSNDDYALKIYRRIDNVDMDLFFFYKNFRKKLGADVSLTIGDALELHSEALVARGSDRYYPKQLSETVYDWQNDRDDVFYSTFLLGGQYTTDDSVNIIFEYYHDPLGMTREEYDTYTAGVNVSVANTRYAAPGPWYGFLMNSYSYYNFAKFRQNYLFFRISKDDFVDDVNVNIASFVSVDEKSALLLPSIGFKINDNLLGNCSLYLPVGGNDSEFRKYYDNYLSISFDYFF
jgi:hypothetical protein